MSEKGMRKTVVKALRPLDAIAVENPAYPGTPDVNGIEFWIELKWASSWPGANHRPLRIPHFTRQQKLWLTKRWSMGGAVYLLLKVGQEWLLFEGDTAALVVGEGTRDKLRASAICTWQKRLNSSQLVEILKNGRSKLS